MPSYRVTRPDEPGAHAHYALQQEGPLFPFSVGLHPEQRRAMSAAGQTVTAAVHGRALIDTGAVGTVVSDSVATRLGLKVVSETRLIGVTGELRVPLAVAELGFPGTGLSSLPMTVMVNRIPVPGPDVIALLGRDVLRRARLTYDGPGGWVELTIHD